MAAPFPMSGQSPGMMPGQAPGQPPGMPPRPGMAPQGAGQPPTQVPPQLLLEHLRSIARGLQTEVLPKLPVESEAARDVRSAINILARHFGKGPTSLSVRAQQGQVLRQMGQPQQPGMMSGMPR